MWHDQPKYKARRTPATIHTKASDVTVTKADGTVTIMPAYTKRQLEKITAAPRKKRKKK